MLLYTVGKMHMDSSLFLPLTAGVLRLIFSWTTPHKARLTALHAICVQIFRHIALGNLPKNLTTHLTHKLCAVLPLQFFCVCGTIKMIRRHTMHSS